MAKRSPVPQKKDQRVFQRTAKKTKTINVAPKVMRGGTRL